MGVNEAAIRTNATEPISKIHIEENFPEMKKNTSSLKGFTVDFVKSDTHLDVLNITSKIKIFPKLRKKKQIT